MGPAPGVLWNFQINFQQSLGFFHAGTIRARMGLAGPRHRRGKRFRQTHGNPDPLGTAQLLNLATLGEQHHVGHAKEQTMLDHARHGFELLC